MTDDLKDTLREKSVKDKVKGKFNEAVGKTRHELGDLTDNHSEEVKGKYQEVKGKMQQKKGEAEEEIADDLSVARDRRRDAE